MTMLIIETQYRENYGAHDWDGEGECPQYWKSKGGKCFKISGVPLNIDYAEVVAAANVEYKNEYAEMYIIDWFLEQDNYMSSFEKDQLEWDGKIMYSDPVIQYSDLVEETV